MDQSTFNHGKSGDTNPKGRSRSPLLELYTRSLQNEREEKIGHRTSAACGGRLRLCYTLDEGKESERETTNCPPKRVRSTGLGQHWPYMRRRVKVSTQLVQIAKKAELDRKVRFTSLAHLLTPEFLKETWGTINRDGASGVDGESIEQFESELEQRIQEMCAQLKAGAYRAPPVRRGEKPKGPGKTGTRPLGIPTVADRLLQKAVARILGAIFEVDFCNASYGYRPGRSPHHALRALRTQIRTGWVNHVFEADIRGYFNHVCHSWLQRMLRERIADPVILSLIGKWLRAGAMQDGVVVRSEEGTPQGGPISCILANIYLHFFAGSVVRKEIQAA